MPPSPLVASSSLSNCRNSMDNQSKAARSSSTFSNARTYDVFLSYRGEDTRNSFISHLYGALDRRGVYTFKDDEKFEKGRPIAGLMKALKESRISIVVLSPNFADSGWCLDELVRILECKDVQSQEVLPIFYNVDPSHVRRLQGSFGKAFSKLQANLCERQSKKDQGLESPVNENVLERVQKWRNALEDVSSISGYCTKDREEFVIVEEVVKMVLAKLHEEKPNNTENLIGLTSRLEHLDLLLDVGSDDVRFVGIWGMGGIGKTTIATAAYEKHFNKFEGHYFLPTVRESYRGNDPTPLQEKILRGVLKDRNLSLDFLSGKGRAIMKERLCQKRVLIVLDDVDRADQLENLVGRHDWFGPGSRVLVTTREKHLLVLHQVDEIYKAEFLDNVEAMKLFCRHAFKANYHNEAYTALSKQMVQYANGLPLALRVWGSFLYLKSVKVWESELKKLQKISNLDIFNILKVSYDGLDDTQKDILLDIACFFKGGTREYVRDIMDSCGFFGESGIEVLIDKCLVTIVENRIWMHDLVQEMGWQIVRQQSRHPSERTRLWSFDDVCHALRSNKDKQVEGIFVDLADPREMKFPIEDISRMKKLRVLRVGYLLHHRSLDYAAKGEDLSYNLDISEYVHERLLCEWRTWEIEEVDIAAEESFLSQLICLHWDNYHMISLPSSFHPRNITELSLCNSRIRQLWVGVKNFEKLKYVNLSWSFNLTSTPDLSGAPNLERLILDSCVHLHELHPSVASLKRLIVLNLNFCQRLLSLPSKLHLVSLQDLGLYRCSNFRVFPEIIEPMEHVTELNLFNSKVEELPPSIELLCGLRSLNLSSCKILRSLPGTICKLKSLEYLTVSGCSLLESFPEIEEEMPKLRELLLDATPIKELPTSLDKLTGLEWLNLDNCWNLTCIPDEILLLLKSLKYVHVEGCFKLDDQSLENLHKVMRLERKFVNRHHLVLNKSLKISPRL